MKAILLIVALATTNVFAEDCTVQESAAKEIVAVAQNRFQRHEAILSDVYEAELSLLQVQLNCAKVVRGNKATPGTYCAQENQVKMTDYVASVSFEVQTSQRAPHDLRNAELEKAMMDSICQEPMTSAGLQ